MKIMKGTVNRVLFYIFATLTICFLPGFDTDFNTALSVSIVRSTYANDVFNEKQLEHYRKKLIKRELRSLTGRERKFLQRALTNMFYYIDLVKGIFSSYGIPEKLVYLPIIESAYSPRAYSRAGAVGIWQFMKGTGSMYGLKVDFWVDERRDPEKATVAAARHLKDLYNIFSDWDLALLAYNAGVGRIRYAIKRCGRKNAWELIQSGCLNSETRRYLPRFYASVEIAEHIKKYGFFSNVERNKNGINVFTNSRKIELDYPVDLTIVASKSGVSLKTLKFYNPELRRFITPPGRHYEIRVPEKHYVSVLSVCRNIPPQKLIDVKEYIIKSGETLGEIAVRFKTSQSLLCRINNIKNPKRVYAGQLILVPVKNKDISIDNSLNPQIREGFLTQEIEYVVKKGDSLWSIARRFGTTIENILSINGLSFSSIINPGDKIKILIDLPFTR